jgi:hypothetical protein
MIPLNLQTLFDAANPNSMAKDNRFQRRDMREAGNGRDIAP